MSVPRLQQGTKEQLPFEELRLAVGERVRLEIRAPKARFTVSYIGHVSGRTLLLSMPQKSPRPPALAEGSAVTVRLIASNRACAFTSRIQKLQLKPVPTLYLDYPPSVEAVLVRKAPRVASRLVVSLDEVVEGALGGGWPRQALCSDISLHGARIEASDLLAEVNEQLFMTVRMRVGELDQLLLTRCVVRNLEDLDELNPEDYRVIHGVEFLQMDEDTQLTLTGFVYQQMLKERGAL